MKFTTSIILLFFTNMLIGQKTIEKLEENDDVSSVFHTMDESE